MAHGYAKMAGKPIAAICARHGRAAARFDGAVQRLVEPGPDLMLMATSHAGTKRLYDSIGGTRPGLRRDGT